MKKPTCAIAFITRKNGKTVHSTFKDDYSPVSVVKGFLKKHKFEFKYRTKEYSIYELEESKGNFMQIKKFH